MKESFFLPVILFFLVFSNHEQKTRDNSFTKPVYTQAKGETPEQLVQRQLDAYNARDIDAFMATYAEEIVLLNFPGTAFSRGQSEMRKRYAVLFENTPNLFCEIKKRIVIGNKVIDQEYVRINDGFINAVAIYEVHDGLISKVTFIRE